MSEINKVVDGDTADITGDARNERVRIEGINTAESVSLNQENTETGKRASKFASSVLPVGSEVETDISKTDKFQRKVGKVSRVINGTPIDMGLVQLDQNFSSYYTKHGKHSDPTTHEQYKEYYSPYAPFEAGDNVEPLSRVDFTLMAEAQKNFEDTKKNFEDGKATQEELDAAMVHLYKDGDKVSRFRHQLHNWDKDVSWDAADGSVKFGMQMVLKDPAMREQYNRAVRNSTLEVYATPEAQPTFWEKTKASFSMMNDVSSYIDANDLWHARRMDANGVEVTDEDLISNVPARFHSMLIAEKQQTNSIAAMTLKEQLEQDLANDKIWQNTNFFEGLLLGAGAMITSPVALTGGGLLASGSAKAAQYVGTVATKQWMKSTAIKKTATMANWAALGFSEEAIAALPRLAADHTYMAKDYYLDTMLGGAFGLGLGGIVEGVAKPFVKGIAERKELRDSRDAEARELQAHAEAEAMIAKGELPQAKNEAEATYNDKVNAIDNTLGAQTKVRDTTNMFDMDEFKAQKDLEKSFSPELVAENKIAKGELPQAKNEAEATYNDKVTSIDNTLGAQTKVRDTTNMFDMDEFKAQKDLEKSFSPELVAENKIAAKQKGELFTKWEAVNKISPKGFRAISETLMTNFPVKKQGQSGMRFLINSQLGLNAKKLNPDQRKIANELNSLTAHIAGAFPDGKIPKNVDTAIKQATFAQQKFKQNAAMSDLLQGKVSNETGTLNKYVNFLEDLSVFKGVDILPVSRREFFEQNTEVLNRLNDLAEDDVHLTKVLPKEVSFLKDVVELNKMAAVKDNPDFTALMERMNGVVAARLEQLELGTLEKFTDSTKSFGKSAKMSAPEIAAKLKEEGLKPKTPEYSTRLKELRQTGRVAVSEEVNAIGKVNEFEIGMTDTKRALKVDSVEETNRADLDLREKESVLVADDLDQDLLPRSFKEKAENIKAFKDPSVDNLKMVKTRLTDIANKLGVLKVTGKAEFKAQNQRINAVKVALKKDKKAVIDRMILRQDMNLAMEVIQASDSIARNAKRADMQLIAKLAEARSKQTVEGSEANLEEAYKEIASENVKATAKSKGEIWDKLDKVEQHKRITTEIAAVRKADVAPSKNPLTETLKEEDFDVLDKHGPEAFPEEIAEVQAKVDAAVDFTSERTAKKIGDGIAEWVRVGGKRLLELNLKPRGALDRIGRMASFLTKDIGTRLQQSKLTSLQYFGANVTEVGKGFGGASKRTATGGLIKHAEYQDSIMQIAPHYVRSMDAYAMSKGEGALGKMKAQQEAGVDSPIVKQFNRDVFTIQELRRQGKPLPKAMDESVIKFVDDWDKYMDHNFNKMVENGIGGFNPKKKVKNYIPHVWMDGKFKGAISTHGIDKVTDVIEQAYKRSMHAGTNPRPPEEARAMAQDLIREVMDDTIVKDGYMPMADSRAKHRQDLDTTTEIDGLSILDLLDDEVIGLATKYSHRMSGWVGLSKSTKGMFTSLADIDGFKKNVIAEGKDKGVDTKKGEQFYDDVINMMFGRPTRDGLDEELRQIKDLTALRLMGGLGTAQLIETGQVITRSTLQLFSDKAAVKKVFDLAGEDINNKQLMREIQSISSITNDIEFMDRQSVHLDQAKLDEAGNVRKLSLWLADKGTFGKHKAIASRALGKVSGFNAVRRFQFRVSQASFVVDVAKHFKSGTGKMGNARMADVGLTDSLGDNVDLANVFKKYVEFDEAGLPTKLNVDKWPKHVREEFQYAMTRDANQQVQHTVVGELPPWMNNPLMALAFQFRQMPIVAQNKSLGRSMAFADKEAVTGVMLNAAMSGMVRYSKFAVLGLGVATITGNEWKEPNGEMMDVPKYITQFGMFPDTVDLVTDSYKAGVKGDIKKALGQVPALNTAFQYMEALGITEGRGQMDAAMSLVPLQNTVAGDMTQAGLREIFGDLKLPEIKSKPTKTSKPKTSVSSKPETKVTKSDKKHLDFIKKEEQFHATAYKDNTQHSIGYGTRTDDPDEISGAKKISKAEATRRLEAWTAKDKKYIESKGNWTKNELAALTSFTYNLGRGNFNTLIKGRDKKTIAKKIKLYNKSAGKVLTGLVKRRDAESKLFSTPDK